MLEELAVNPSVYPFSAHASTKASVVSLTITFVQPDKRARDRDNLLAALKPSLDGIADALEVNDSQFDPLIIRREFGAKPGHVVVEVQ
jgi:crossover junction endodeoxyribonuclease RusA